MTTGFDLWDFQVWDFFITLAILFAAMILANFLIKVIKPIRKLLIPAPVLGGFLLLAFLGIYKAISGNDILEPSTLEMLTYHGLGLGCAALALKTSEKKPNQHAGREIFNSSLVTTSTYLLQGICGLAISIGLFFLINCWPASGMLVPMGYGQGPGQAYNWGHTYETTWGFENGTSFGLTVAALGFVACSIGGVLYLNIMRRRHNPKILTDVQKAELAEQAFMEEGKAGIMGKNEIPLSDTMDKLSVQFALTFLAYAIALGISYGVSILCDMSGVGILVDTVKPLFWGFNFIFATIGGIIIKAIMNGCTKKGLMKKVYTNNVLLDRVSGLMFDVMIVAAIGSINLSAFKQKSFVIPMLVMCAVAAVLSYLYVSHVCKKLFPKYNDESFLALYGMLTGVVGTGVILLREIDPRFETLACNNLLLQTLWTCLLGFPILLLMGFAPRSMSWAFITLGILVVLFIVFYVWIRLAAKKVAKVSAKEAEQE